MRNSGIRQYQDQDEQMRCKPVAGETVQHYLVLARLGLCPLARIKFVNATMMISKLWVLPSKHRNRGTRA